MKVYVPVRLDGGPFAECELILEVPTGVPHSLPGDDDDTRYPAFVVPPPDRIVVGDSVYRRKVGEDGVQWHWSDGAWTYELVP